MKGDPLTFDCPRCGRGASGFTYGPCSDCRTELRATLHGERSDAEIGAIGRYEPKMNVVPNHVATKD